jgi:hypothetical protein
VTRDEAFLLFPIGAILDSALPPAPPPGRRSPGMARRALSESLHDQAAAPYLLRPGPPGPPRP